VSRPGDGVWPVIVTARPVMIFAAVLFPGLSSLVIDEVEDTRVVLRLRARTSIPKGCVRNAGGRRGGRRRRHATMVIDAITHRRVDVLPDRKAATRRHRRLRRAQSQA